MFFELLIINTVQPVDGAKVRHSAEVEIFIFLLFRKDRINRRIGNVRNLRNTPEIPDNPAYPLSSVRKKASCSRPSGYLPIDV